MSDYKFGLKPKDVEDKILVPKLDEKWNKAQSVMKQRTAGHEFFSKLAHNQTLYEKGGVNKDNFSEGSSQAIKRKIRAQTIQRIPDGQITTQFDKNSIEQIETEFLFNHKILTSEYDGKDMMKHLWRTFNAAYDYGYACVRTGFEKDLDNDIRVSYTLIQWNDIYPEPDCKFIEEAEWYMVREYISRAELAALLNEDGSVKDSTYEEKTVQFLLQDDMKDGIDPKSLPLADKKNGVSPINSIEIRTFYKRGEDKFVTYVPSIQAILRTVNNEDPRKDVPLHFLILEPDPEFPLGCSSVMWTMAQQQFADAFQTLSYQTLLLACNPPLMGFGNLTPSKIKMQPRAFWPMGNNTNTKIEKFPVETTTITQYGSILENVSANMMKNLNITDATVASDANVMNYSGTPQGVEQQRADKTITINQYQKRVEIFFGEWANHALRSYINSMSGEVEITVDEETRRRIWDIEMSNESMTSIINGDKIKIDFDSLSADMLNFEVRTGSLVESEKEKERRAIQELLLAISQMLSNVSEENRKPFEDNIMQLMVRLCELSDVDISQQTANRIDEQLIMGAMQASMEAIAGQQQQIDGMQQQLAQLTGGAQGMPPTEQEPMQAMPAAPMEGMPQEPQLPPEAQQAMPPMQAEEEEEMPANVI